MNRQITKALVHEAVRNADGAAIQAGLDAALWSVDTLSFARTGAGLTGGTYVKLDGRAAAGFLPEILMALHADGSIRYAPDSGTYRALRQPLCCPVSHRKRSIRQ